MNQEQNDLINDLLQKALAYALVLERLGKFREARTVLAETSKQAIKHMEVFINADKLL